MEIITPIMRALSVAGPRSGDNIDFDMQLVVELKGKDGVPGLLPPSVGLGFAPANVLIDLGDCLGGSPRVNPKYNKSSTSCIALASCADLSIPRSGRVRAYDLEVMLQDEW
ncbi:uncharacterized protein TrAtP1_001846 [Trichoderma atroviride]|uniref:uncharacterized protein n=1 Tax=Hypocrea atroviridis TaxID=63577 RepID=UPI003329A4E7|nr:hypothetical protein TrAtP1_001846 [Trichoderma atroviride]